jgi:hypothetical protein
MVRLSDSETSEDESVPLPDPAAAQKTTMLNFFKRVNTGGPQVTNSTKASVKQTTADKKRKKDKIVTNGGRGSNKSPPPKKRIEDNCEKDEVSSILKNGSSCNATTAIGSAAAGIGNFFRSITKKEFIADNEKNQSLTVVKALVHSNNIGGSGVVLTSTSTGTSPIESEASKKRKRGSKYVRRSDETDVIQILEEETDDMGEGGSLLVSSAEVNPLEMETECDLAQGPSSSSPAYSTTTTKVILISTKQMFKKEKLKKSRLMMRTP